MAYLNRDFIYENNVQYVKKITQLKVGLKNR